MPKRTYWITAFCLCLLMLFCAAFSPIFYDEQQTLQNIQGATFADIANYRSFITANNHLFISLWGRLISTDGDVSPVLFRLPSLLSFFVFAVFLYKLLKLHRRDAVRSPYTIVLLILPYAAYFFVARGYAIAMAFMTVALYYYKLCVSRQADEDGRAKWIVGFTIAGCISSLSIFSFYYGFAAIGLWLFAKFIVPEIRSGKFSAREKMATAFSMVAVTVLTVYIYRCGKIISINDPAIIGTNNLLKDGALSSIFTYLSLENHFTEPYRQMYKLLIAVSMVAAILYVVLKRAVTDEGGILVTVLGLLILSHYVMGSMYPVTRGLMFLIFLMYLNMVYVVARHQSVLVKMHLLVVGAGGLVFMGLSVWEVL